MQHSLDRQVANLAHERVSTVVELDVAAFSSDLPFVQGALGVLSDALRFEQDKGRTGASTVLLFDVDVVGGEASKAIEERLDLWGLDPVRKTAHYECPVLVVAADIVREASSFAASVASATSAGWTVEIQIIAIADHAEFNIARSDGCLIEFLRSCRSLFG